MGNSRDSRFVNLAKQHLSNKAQRSQAKITLLKIGDPTARIDTEKHMLELTNSALLSLLARLSEQNVMLSSGVITELINRTILNYVLAESILNLGEKIGRENYQRWLLGFLTQCNDATILISAYHFAIQHDVRGQVKQIGSKWSSNPEVLSQYLKWQYLQSVSFSENQILTLRLMLNQLLWHSQLDNKQKQTLLEIAAKHDDFVANNFLLNNKIGISERQIAAILLEISPLQPSIQQIKLFEHIINNQESPPQDRLIAAAGLLLIKPSRKQEILAKL
jgi:hypothetical protein